MVAWIRVIDFKEAEGDLKEIYRKVISKRGNIANVFKAHSLNPESLEAHLNLYMTIVYGKSNLSRFQREAIAVTVSHINGCNYCVTHHYEALSRYTSEENAKNISRGSFEKTNISHKDKVLLRFASKLTKHPNEIKEDDIKKLREVGFSDRDILDATLVISYFNFVNRFVQALGIKLEPREERKYNY